MATTTFDALAYFEKLKAAGVPEEQATIQANAFRDISLLQAEKWDREACARDERIQKEQASKADLREVELRLQKEIREVEFRLQKEIREVELRLLRWQWGIAIALATIMAKGFGWLGF